MTGTALTEAEEFFDIYKLPVVSIPTNKKMIRNSYRIENSSGFKTCRFSKLEKVFTSEGVKLASK